ncbi:MAG: WG repeat-containing protein [Lewinellaceae bacterium]|nr:WG repeat-containing protein [Lewinellaceae bacterium]
MAKEMTINIRLSDPKLVHHNRLWFFLFSILLAFSCSNKPGSGQRTADTAIEEESQAAIEEQTNEPVFFSDTSKSYTIVLKPDIGFVAVNKKGETLYEVFPYDNGPDYPSDGYFRIIDKGKIGYADEETGAVRISPQYAAARPFENGYAAICPGCESQKDGEYSSWVNGKWGLIDKNGKVVIKPRFEEILEISKDGRVLAVEGGEEKWVKL